MVLEHMNLSITRVEVYYFMSNVSPYNNGCTENQFHNVYERFIEKSLLMKCFQKIITDGGGESEGWYNQYCVSFFHSNKNYD